MSLVTMIKCRKVIAGMVAVAAGTATVAAPVVALPLSADPTGDTTASPAINGGDAGTYESCSALFGLTDKTNANYVTFNVAGTADPLPGIGQGLTPVITVTDPESGDVDQCVPEIGFNDAESRFAFLNTTEIEEVAELVVPYPGTTGYLIPASKVVVTSAGTAEPAQPAPAPLSIALRIGTDSTVLVAFTVTWGPSELLYPSIDSDEEAAAIIVDELGGPAIPLGMRFAGELLEGPCTCSYAPANSRTHSGDSPIHRLSHQWRRARQARPERASTPAIPASCGKQWRSTLLDYEPTGAPPTWHCSALSSHARPSLAWWP